MPRRLHLVFAWPTGYIVAFFKCWLIFHLTASGFVLSYVAMLSFEPRYEKTGLPGIPPLVCHRSGCTTTEDG